MITKAERRVLTLLADGLDTRAISRRLGQCDSAASTTLTRLCRKLGLQALPNRERYRRLVVLFLTGEAMQR